MLGITLKVKTKGHPLSVGTCLSLDVTPVIFTLHHFQNYCFNCNLTNRDEAFKVILELLSVMSAHIFRLIRSWMSCHIVRVQSHELNKLGFSLKLADLVREDA